MWYSIGNIESLITNQSILMNTDKRSFYVWMIVVLANVSVYLSAAISVIRDGNSIIDGLLSPITQHFLIAIVCIFISVVPAWLSGSNLKFRNRLGYIGVPILLLLPVPYLVWMANHGTHQIKEDGDNGC